MYHHPVGCHAAHHHSWVDAYGCGPLGPVLLCFHAPPASACAGRTMTLPQELTVDATTLTDTALIGGSGDAHLTLEYLVETATSQIDVASVSDGTTSTWNVTDPPQGYHVEEGFLTVKPGTKVTLTTDGPAARLRWCETICC